MEHWEFWKSGTLWKNGNVESLETLEMLENCKLWTVWEMLIC